MHNNDWYEKGELPPVGTDCEYIIGERRAYLDCTFVGLNSRGSVVIETPNGEYLSYHKHQIKFRPLSTERDKLIERAFSDVGRLANDDDTYFIERLVVSGWRPVKPQSEDEFIHESLEIGAVDKVLQLPLRTLYRAGCRFIDMGTNND